MIHMQKNKTRRDRADDTEQTQPTRVDERAAEASDNAECCLSDIDDVLDDVLADVDQALEEDKAREEYAGIIVRHLSGEIDREEGQRQMRVWRAKYAHLDHGCTC